MSAAGTTPSDATARRSAFLKNELNYLTKQSQTAKDLGSILLDVVKLAQPEAALQIDTGKKQLDDITNKFSEIVGRLSRAKGNGAEAVDPLFAKYDKHTQKFVDARAVQTVAPSIASTAPDISSRYSAAPSQSTPSTTPGQVYYGGPFVYS